MAATVNPIHNRRLYEVWGGGTKESADKWDDIMRQLYADHNITSQRQLSIATNVPTNTLQSCGAFKEPHRMTFRTFIRICRALNADTGQLMDAFSGFDYEAAKAFDATYEATKKQTLELVRHFLTLSQENQDFVLSMVGNIKSEGGDDAHSVACELLSEQIESVVERCKSWDHIDLS